MERAQFSPMLRRMRVLLPLVLCFGGCAMFMPTVNPMVSAEDDFKGGTLLYSHDHPEEITGVLALAPFLGIHPVAAEIRKEGGPAKWKAPEKLEITNEDTSIIELWRWLKAVTGGHEHGPKLYLGWGTPTSTSWWERCRGSRWWCSAASPATGSSSPACSGGRSRARAARSQRVRPQPVRPLPLKLRRARTAPPAR